MEIKKHSYEKFVKEFNEKDVDTTKVIYIDTDSIFIELNEIVSKLENKVNKDRIDIILNIIVPKLQNLLNTYFIPQLANKIHNVDLDEITLNLKQEVIAKSAYFLDKIKKRYALYIINKEGVEVDEYDIKGLEIKRSDFPRITKEKLEEMLDIILKSDKIDIFKLLDFVDKTKRELMNLILDGDVRVSRPVSFSKDMDDYKTIPQHIKGMVWWNILEYNYFLPGTKGYLFKIKGIDPSKAPNKITENFNKAKNENIPELGNKMLDVIVIPQELDKLPDYFVIDTHHMINYAWEDRVRNLLGNFIEIKMREVQKRRIATF